MRIGFDIRCLMEGKRTGVEEYTLWLLTNLLQVDKENQYILFLNSFKEITFDITLFTQYENVEIKFLRVPNKILNASLWYLKRPHLDKLLGGVEVMVLPNISFSAVSSKAKLVSVLHDLSFESYLETFSLKRKLWHLFINPRKLCRKSDKIITVSRSSKDDLERIYKIKKEKIKVIPSAVNNNFRLINRNDPRFLEVKEEYNLPYYYILYLGTLEPRKNLVSLIRAYSKLRKLNIPYLNRYKLVLAGGKGWKYESIFQEAQESFFSKDIIFTGFIEDEDKPYLYNLASLFVYPSFLEGFGFPPLEAMACGTPVISSNCSSFPEVVGGAGIMIDPDRPEEIKLAMKEILSSKELQKDLRQKGLEKSRLFTWKKTAREFLKVLEDLE